IAECHYVAAHAESCALHAAGAVCGPVGCRARSAVRTGESGGAAQVSSAVASLAGRSQCPATVGAEVAALHTQRGASEVRSPGEAATVVAIAGAGNVAAGFLADDGGVRRGE